MNAALAMKPAEAPCAESPVRHWFRDALRTAFFSGLVGLLPTVLRPSLYGLIENFVYSECVGLCIYSAVTLLGRFVDRGNRTFTGYLLRGVVAIPVGLFAGLNLGAWLCGHPVGFAVVNDAALYAFPITIVASGAIMYVLWSKKRMADVATAQAEAERMAAEARLKLLQTQIEPHMLFNTLANLRTLVDVDTARAQAMIDELIVYLRGTLAASRQPTVRLADEFAQLAAYLSLMQVRMASRLRVELDLPPALGDLPVPPMLLQPLVENAIKHGLEPKIAGGTVRVAAARDGDRVQFVVEDDGVGLDAEQAVAADGGYGLTHVRDRLQMLHGDAASVVLEPRDGGGVRVRIRVPA